MHIAARDVRLLFQQSGNRCAFPTCTKELSYPPSDKDGAVATSEVAHIVAQSIDGPRGDHPMPMEERSRYENLILMCEEHHTIIDAQIASYPVELLRQMKYDHESVIAEATRKAVETRAINHIKSNGTITEMLYSSLLPVERLPLNVFSIECQDVEREVKNRLVHTNVHQAAPFICRGGRLYCFQNLRDEPGPFVNLTKGAVIEKDEATTWWAHPDTLRWYTTLLNRTLNKLTGWRGLNLDKEHNRYFFEPDKPGQVRTITYKPMNRSVSQLQVVWQPLTKKTQQPKKFWYHRAVAMRFDRVGPKSWCLALRPEMRVTRDSVTPLQPRRVGSKITKKKSRMWNIDVLEELNFWRDFFFAGKPRLIVPFGNYTAVSISANFLRQSVQWPGVPAERAKSFKNAEVEEDLFELAALDRIENQEEWDDDLIEYSHAAETSDNA